MTGTLTAGALVSTPSALESRRGRDALRKTNYAPIDEHRTATSNSDIAAAWVSAGLAGLALLAGLAA